MSDLVHKVPREELFTAEKRFNELFNPGWWYRQYNFKKFLGINDYWYSAHDRYIYCTELAFRKIEMLNSPHAYALMKAFIARTGYHKKLVEKDHDTNPV